ncbi:squalene/phytoene synthase family protein [Akkermansiaceae bacterium]|nr:squalene/phytoene synthase family protein [Akkermansiaceae bacterium]
MAGELERDVLKGVSRSFYLSVRLLPAPMRRPAGIAYLLARTSDTIADSTNIPASERLDWLEDFSRQVSGVGESVAFPSTLIEGTPDPREKILLGRHLEILAALRTLNEGLIPLIRDVIAIIISGQKLDLERFGNPGKLAALSGAEQLDDYTWRVAGCVGAFWTKLGFETLGKKFSKSDPVALLADGIAFGKGLQLVNILRDLPKDLRNGRCYLPVSDPGDQAELMSAFPDFLATASAGMDRGLRYASALRSKRLRMASALPAMIGNETLELMENADFATLEAGVRIPRSRVYRLTLDAFLKA